MTNRSILAAVGFLLMTHSPVWASDITVETMPPSVIKTVPASGELDVDPSLDQIRVTFSKDMMTDRMWSWVMASPDSFPEISGDVKYLADGRTCVAPVNLEPGKTYVIWFNSQSNDSFRDLGNRPAVPYLLVFKTRD
jgi:RNA polymerase sigma-70 factor (ECF subfamily)